MRQRSLPLICTSFGIKSEATNPSNTKLDVYCLHVCLGRLISHPSVNTVMLILMREGYIEVKIGVRSHTKTDDTSELLKAMMDVELR